ncbi:MAG: acetyl-CoA carboxylase biotin carboxylase subunit family protein [Sandaracinaceae bacterium]
MARPPLSQPPAAPPVILVIGGGPFQLDIVRTARDLGATVAVADRDPNAPAFALAHHALVIDIVDHAALIAAARALSVSCTLSAASDIALPAVAAVAEALGLRALAPDVVARCRDKRATFEVLDAAGLAVPPTVWVDDEHDARAASEEVGGYPLVVKPRSAAGGRGVSVVRDPHGLAVAIERARRYDKDGCLVQSFVGGHAVGAEAFFWDARPIMLLVMDDQFDASFVSPVGHSLPSALPDEVQARVRADVVRFAEALGLTEGPANFDLRVDGDRTVLLEVNPRLGGNSITDLARSAYGVDLSAATVRAAMGQDPSAELALRDVTPTASRLMIARGGGIAELDDPFGGITDRAGIVTVELAVQAAQAARLRVDDHAILGRCVVRGGDASEAVRRAERIASEVSARIRLVEEPADR